MSVRGRELAEQEVKKYVYKNLAMFHRVQVTQMIHLPCLTETDRQKIRATYANEGNNETTFFFFQCLCCREGWVPLFVGALREQNMGDLAAKLENLYHSKLLPPLNTRPVASAPPVANRPSVPPPRPEANEQSPPEKFFAQALPSTPPRLAPSPANPPPQNMGDYRIPVQENSHPAEKSKLAVPPESTDKGAEPGFSSTSDVSSASKAEASVEQNWDGRQHHPVTVKNGCFGNAHRPQESGTGSALPTGANSSNQPEEDYYSSDSILLALGGPREDAAAERKVHVLRGDQRRENPPVADSLQSSLDSQRKNLPAYERSPEDQTQPFMDPSSRSAPANDAQPSFTRIATKPPFPIPNPVPEYPIRLSPLDLEGSSSVGTKAPKPRREFSAAGGDRTSDDFKLPVQEKISSGEITSTGALAGRPQWGMETRPPAVGDHKRDTRIFHSNRSENDMPSKPGVLSSDHAADDAGETNNMYSGSSERLRMSNSDSISGRTSDSDPILMSGSSSDGHSTTSTTRGRNRPSGAVDTTLPPEVEAGEEDTSFRSHHLLMEKDKSMDLMGVPLDGASLRPSPRDFPDSVSDGQPENKAKDHQADPSFPDEVEEATSSVDFSMLFVGLALAFLASAIYVLSKKK